jgi:hypothetical protein
MNTVNKNQRREVVLYDKASESRCLLSLHSSGGNTQYGNSTVDSIVLVAVDSTVLLLVKSNISDDSRQ